MNKKILEQFELLVDMIKSNLNTARKIVIVKKLIEQFSVKIYVKYIL